MSFEIGLWRIAKITRGIGGILAALIGIGGAIATGPGKLGSLFFLVAGAVIYGTAWSIAWVLEGFAEDVKD